MSDSEVQQFLQQRKIGSAVVYPFSMNEQPFYQQRCQYDNLDIAVQHAKQVLSIPVHPALTEQDIATVAAAIIEFLAQS